ncbi:phage scaffolding protein [Clostridium butyricum]|uniref:phage scaffolding protein n=1 Tax=Clostridium butyricum TaxID=1492 RepID=UPI0022E08BF8|nr:phage scaffolding protein [Clostridium butyricum]
MKTEFLKGLGLTDEQITSVMAENGKDIKKEKDKADEFERELKDSNTQLKQANDTISDLKKNNADNEELQKKVTKYEEDMKTQKETYEKEINDMKYSNALNDVLSKYSFQDDDAKEFVISKIKDKTEFKNGEFIGINDVMTDMQKNKGYLFKVDPSGTGSFVTGGAEGSDPKSGNENIATKLGKQRAEATKSKSILDFAK